MNAEGTLKFIDARMEFYQFFRPFPLRLIVLCMVIILLIIVAFDLDDIIDDIARQLHSRKEWKKMRSTAPSAKDIFLVEDQDGCNTYVLNGFTRVEIVNEQIPEDWNVAEGTEDLQEIAGDMAAVPYSDKPIYSIRVYFEDEHFITLGYYEAEYDAKTYRDNMLQAFLSGEAFYSMIPAEPDVEINPIDREDRID